MNLNKTMRSQHLFIYLLIASLLTLSSCKHMVKEEPYLKSTQSETISLPEHLDSPNQSNTLDIPKKTASHGSMQPDIKPPEIGFINKRSNDERINILEINNIATLQILKHGVKPWLIMEQLALENWTILEKKPAACLMIIQYQDPDKEEKENTGFFKRMFTKHRTPDLTSRYVIKCQETDNKSTITAERTDNEKPNAILIDQLLGTLFNIATQTTPPN